MLHLAIAHTSAAKPGSRACSGLTGPGAVAWAQAYLSAAAIVVSGAFAVLVPALDRRQRREDVRETAFHALVDAYSVLHALLKNSGAVADDLDLVLLANLEATSALLAQTPLDQLGSFDAIRSIADTRRQIYIVSRIVAQPSLTREMKTAALKDALEHAQELRALSFERRPQGREAPGPAIEARFAAEGWPIVDAAAWTSSACDVQLRLDWGGTMTTVATGEAAPPTLDIGRVISMTSRVLFRRALDLIIIGLPFIYLPNMLVEFLPPGFSAVRLAAGLPGLIFIGAVSLLAYRDIAGEPRVDAATAIRAGAAKFGSLWGVGLISNIGAGIGLLLLIVPGVVLGSCLASASSAVMVESITATAAIERSWSLSKGSRWRLAALLLVALLAAALVLLFTVLVGVVLGLTLGAEHGEAAGRIVWAPFASIWILAITTVGSTAAYVGLRRVREGGVAVADVFA